MELAHQYVLAERIGKTFGELNFGPDASEWPAWAEDVIVILTQQKAAVDLARQIAANRAT